MFYHTCKRTHSDLKLTNTFPQQLCGHLEKTDYCKPTFINHVDKDSGIIFCTNAVLIFQLFKEQFVAVGAAYFDFIPNAGNEVFSKTPGH